MDKLAWLWCVEQYLLSELNNSATNHLANYPEITGWFFHDK